MRIVRSLILFLAGAASAAQAQVATDTSANSSAPAARSASPAASQNVEVLGLRSSPSLRVHRLPDEQIPAYLEGNTMDGDPDSTVTLDGSAEVRRIDMVLKGDRITYDRATGNVDAVGGARLMREGSLATAPQMRFNVDTSSGNLKSPDFWLGATGGFAKADQADIFSRSAMRLTNVTYTGCSCSEPSWYIKSKSVDMDFDENEGVAHDGVLYFKDVPILAAPYLTFPIKKERKSGFLIPTYGTTSRSGFDFQAPYYFNLAPNYDATIYPRLLAKRGLQLGGEFRYLGSSYSGLLAGTYLPSDNQTGESRWMYTTRHYQALGNGFFGSWNITGVSDDDYYRDFSTLGLNEASTTYLPKQGMVGWSNQYWTTYVQVYKYQTLQDPDAPILPPYDMEPQLSLRGQRYNWNGFDAEFTSTATRFRRNLSGVPSSIIPTIYNNSGPESGDRLQIYPTVSFPIVRPGWYVTPKVGYHYTQYQNTDWYGGSKGIMGTETGLPTSISRGVPIMSVDAGMTFERDTTLFGKDSIQTLEPRLYYLRVPYRDQSRMPIYDTTLANFSFAQAFEENIYTGGWDRIANANQLTAALTTRYLDANSGFERLSLSVGQQIYFDDQRVTLPSETPRTNVRSNFLVETSAALTDTLTASLGGQYDPYNSDWNQGLVSMRWSPQRLTTVSLSYRYQRDPPVLSTGGRQAYLPQGQNQVSLAFQWPFSERWYGVGRIDYSMHTGPVVGTNNETIQDTRRITQAIAGLEYKGDCCWTGRVVFQRYAVAADEVNTAVFFQLELNGLGSLGTDPMKLLSRSIPGYQSVNPPPVPGTTFERYE
ncbi:LPS biosynthesis protein [Bordetella genomosp. 9]|uniref:LPS-assembly protein LptD n=1 Tax=Bordetella genomosp. 9 TaxID=1416803 RepID=UPI000A2914E5|nr:LPS assembly protein LptD [Bordetella genomosp. 9]ARP91584.1 LPS biosynthesis protein [Bordetella genomosp. 9]